MSHIPSTAMPRAASTDVLEKEEPQAISPAETTTPGGAQDSVELKHTSLMDRLRDNATAVIATGAILATGAIAAAAYPLLRRRFTSELKGRKSEKK